jgi:hypothetical protein
MKFEIMGKKGHGVYDYDLQTAEIKFNELVSANLVPMCVDEQGQHEVMESFDKDATKVRWVPRIAGG